QLSTRPQALPVVDDGDSAGMGCASQSPRRPRLVSLAGGLYLRLLMRHRHGEIDVMADHGTAPSKLVRMRTLRLPGRLAELRRRGAKAAASSGGAARNARSATGRRIRGSRPRKRIHDGSRGAPPAAFRLLRAGLVDDVEGCLGNPAEPRVPGVGGEP